MSEIKKQILGLKVRQQVLYILIFSLVTIMIWVGASLFFSQRKSGIDPQLILLSKPLNPTIDVEAINEIEKKNLYSEQELSNFPIYKIIRSENKRDEKLVILGQEEGAFDN